MSTLEIHPLAQRWPLLPEAELASLAESIATDGLDEPITLSQDGRIVDGRNRLNACELAEVTPIFTKVYFADEAEVRAFVTRKNAQRRNVTVGQKAMDIAEGLALDGKRRDAPVSAMMTTHSSICGTSTFAPGCPATHRAALSRTPAPRRLRPAPGRSSRAAGTSAAGPPMIRWIRGIHQPAR